MTKKEILIAAARSAAIHFLYFERKFDDEISWEDVREMIKSGEVTVHELVAAFEYELSIFILNNINGGDG